MPEEYFDVAYINFDEAILHGRMSDGIGEDHVRRERMVRIVLSDEQKRAIEGLNRDAQIRMQCLLSKFAHAETPAA